MVTGVPGPPYNGYTEELAEKVFLDSGSITGPIDRTERVGFLERRPDPADRRVLRIHLTDAGKSKLKDLEPVLAGVQERLHYEFFAGHTPEPVETFLGLLHQMRETVQLAPPPRTRRCAPAFGGCCSRGL